jgi:hypothetical protein
VKRLLTLAGVMAAATVLITSAGARTGAVPKFDLSTHSGALKYLKSIGVDPKGVVIQRGVHNYAGPNCPGRRWSCTRSTRVFQIAATGGTNQFVCADTSHTATAPPVMGNTDPLNCEITQSAPDGANNSASCTEDESVVPTAMETCLITQVSTTGNNAATVTEKITQNTGSSQTASQYSSIDQTSGSGSNAATVSQDVHQNSNAVDGNNSQSQTVLVQSSCVDQHGTESDQNACTDDQPLPQQSSGVDKSTVSQSVTQNGSAPAGATQTQSDNIFGTVTQWSTGLATNQNTQNEHQNLGGGTFQTQHGPLTCCSSQGTNAGDKFNINQIADQNASQKNATQDNSLDGTCEEVGGGTCKVNQSVGENNGTTKNSCTSTIGCTITIDCFEGTCVACPSNSEFCDGEGPGFVSFVFDSRAVALAARRLLAQLH